MNPIAKTLICLSLAACYASEAPVERVSSPEIPEPEVKVVAMETETPRSPMRSISRPR